MFGFLIQQFFICIFYCQNIAYVSEFQHIPNGMWNIIFSSPLVEYDVPHLLWV
jgi:hypothetical protein